MLGDLRGSNRANFPEGRLGSFSLAAVLRDDGTVMWIAFTAVSPELRSGTLLRRKSVN
jgi:hypothetical protein